MGYSPGGVRFRDGVVMFVGVDSTSDIMLPRMHATVPPDRRQPGSYDAEKACVDAGHELEECEAADSGGFTFKGKACRACMIFHGPGMLYGDGYGDRNETAEAHIVSRNSDWLTEALAKVKA